MFFWPKRKAVTNYTRQMWTRRASWNPSNWKRVKSWFPENWQTWKLCWKTFLRTSSDRSKTRPVFEFFRVPLDKFNEVIQKLQEVFKSPEEPKTWNFWICILWTPKTLSRNRNKCRENKRNKLRRMFCKKTYSIHPDLVDWQKFERYGITREG